MSFGGRPQLSGPRGLVCAASLMMDSLIVREPLQDILPSAMLMPLRVTATYTDDRVTGFVHSFLMIRMCLGKQTIEDYSQVFKVPVFHARNNVRSNDTDEYPQAHRDATKIIQCGNP